MTLDTDAIREDLMDYYGTAMMGPFPTPVLIIATYDEEGNPNAMNAAWGGTYDTNQIMLCLSEDHKTTKNILATGAFTVSYADVSHLEGADYVGIVSGNDVPDKVEKAGFTVVKSEYVNAPVICELPVAAAFKDGEKLL